MQAVAVINFGGSLACLCVCEEMLTGTGAALRAKAKKANLP